MKFLYEYRTPRNERRNGELSASSREAAYAALKRLGIRPSRVELAPGFCNRVAAIGKRGLVISVLAVLCLLLGVVAYRSSKDAQTVIAETREPFDSLTRRQILGDVAEVEKGVRTGWRSVFVEEGDCFLASFAIPGVPAGVRSTNVEELQAALDREVEALPQDDLVARQIKAMVKGMKQELRRFVAAGGTISQYGERLVERQEQEISYYNRVRNEIDAAIKSDQPRAEVEALLERRNAELRAMGIKTIPMPD